MALGLRDITDASLRDMLMNHSQGSAGLAEGTNAGVLKTTNTINYAIDGIWRTAKAATDPIAWGTLATSGVELADLPDGKTGYYTVSLDSGGNFKVNGYVATDPSDQTIIIKAPVAGTAIIGIVKVVNASGAVFNPGTTDLSAAGITATVTQCEYVPVAETL